jgi:hypothetical protein
VKSWRAWDEIASTPNVWRAWLEFERGKRRRPGVAAFGLDAERHVLRLARELRAGNWQPGGYRLLRVVDPKRRLVAAAPVRDRVVHHAVHRVLAPRFNRGFSAHSYACLPGRGSHRAVLTFLDRVRRFRHVLQLDVRRYFYSIDRGVLAGLLLPRCREAPLRDLLQHLLDSGGELYRPAWVADWLGWEQPGPSGKGLPIGNLTSQWWGNLYLDGLDHFCCRALRVPAYQRYMDDITLFADDAATLRSAREALRAWLLDERRLELKDPDAKPMRTDRRFGYLGYEVTRAGLGLGHKARVRLRQRLATVTTSGRLRAALASYRAAWMFGSGRA